MRLGGPVNNYKNPHEWIYELKRLGYRAAYCPVDNKASEAVIKDYEIAASKEDIVIAEVGAWSNTMSTDDKVRKEAIAYCQKQLELADRIGAGCCVNIIGSRGEQWDGPHPDNITKDTFDLAVETVRKIIDEVKPKRTFYTLEPMPWMYPYDADSCLELIKAVDREHFAAHIDIVNVISSPLLYYKNGEVIKEWFKKLAPYIKSCHAKDISLSGKLTVHLDEVILGTGALDYMTLLGEMSKLHKDIPLMLEHLSSEEEYLQAATNLRKIASEYNIDINA